MTQIYRTGQGNEWSSLEGGGLEAAKWVGGIAAGALLMYLLDPERGSARRAQSAAAVRGLGTRTTGAVGKVWRDAGERFGGLPDEARDSAAADPAATTAERASDALSRLGRTVGDALDDTLERARDVASRAGEVLHDGQERASRALGSSTDDWQDRARQLGDNASRAVSQAVKGSGHGAWGPTMRNSALAAGGLLAVTGLLRRSPLGWVAGLAGAALLARGVANQPLRSLLSGRALSLPLDQTVDFDKTIHIDASPETVYDLWANYENFPRFMSHVVEVRDLGRRRSRWVVRGPGGSEFAWNSVLTEQSRPRRLSWRSEPGAEIPQSGSIEFTPSRGGTLATVRMSYTPPAGMLGHGLATLLGADPKARMDEDLARMKAYIERGALPQGAGQSRFSLARFLH